MLGIVRWSDHKPGPKMHETGRLINLVYPDIPSHLIIRRDSGKQVFGILYDKTLVVMEYGLSDLEHECEDDRAGTIRYMHAYAPKKLTLVGLSVSNSNTYRDYTLDAPYLETTYKFTDIVLDRHYVNEPMVNSVRIKYPMNWGLTNAKFETTIHRTIRISSGEAVIKSMQVSECISANESDTKIKERFVIYEIKPGPDTPLSSAMDLTTKFNNFVTLIAGFPMYPQKIRVTDHNNMEFMYYPRSKLVFDEMFPSSIFEPTDFLSIDPYFEKLLHRWFNLYRQVGNPISEYFASRFTASFPRMWFLDYVNTMQRIYKITDPKLGLLKDCLRDSMEIYKKIAPVDEELIEKINDTRNHYVHNRPRTKDTIETTNYGLAILTNTMSMLIEGKMVSMIASFDPHLQERLLVKIRNLYLHSATHVPGLPGSQEGPGT